ncbi:TIGR02147 family protein [Oligoflexaceae bacterium]|nr:TIGR02147 family protein [Oligoflexaceae bacterium]
MSLWDRQQPCFRTFLKDEICKRQQMQSTYSMRKFAKDIGVSPSLLSEVLNRKHCFSVKSAESISNKLGLKGVEKNLFFNLVKSENSRNKFIRDDAKVRVKEIQVNHAQKMIENDVFHLIADWYHLAVMSLLETKDFKSDVGWIAKRLKISIIQAENALNRLVRFKMISFRSGIYSINHSSTSTSDDIPSEAIRKFQSQVLKKAQLSLYHHDVSSREIATMVMSVRKDKLEEAKKELKSFRRRFCRKFDCSDRSADDVYAFHTSFFNLTP